MVLGVTPGLVLRAQMKGKHPNPSTVSQAPEALFFNGGGGLFLLNHCEIHGYKGFMAEVQQYNLCTFFAAADYRSYLYIELSEIILSSLYPFLYGHSSSPISLVDT